MATRKSLCNAQMKILATRLPRPNTVQGLSEVLFEPNYGRIMITLPCQITGDTFFLIQFNLIFAINYQMKHTLKWLLKGFSRNWKLFLC